MNRLNQEQIRDIAQEIDCGQTCYFNKKNGKTISIPNFEDDVSYYKRMFKDELQEVKRNAGDILEIHPPNSRESFRIMRNFIAQLDNKRLAAQLSYALENRKPFRAFNALIDDSGPYRQQWFDFKEEQLIELVKMYLDESEDEA